MKSLLTALMLLTTSSFGFDDPRFAEALKLFADTRLIDISAVCDGRLTLASGIPMNKDDTTDTGTVYYTPYIGNKVSLYNGSRWVLLSFSETSLALSSVVADKNYDIFGYLNTGSLALELSAAWTNDSTRADALTTQDGVKVKSSDHTRRLLGTFRSTGVNLVRDMNQYRHLWNECNRIQRNLVVETGAGSNFWNGATVSFNGDPSARVQFVAGDTMPYEAIGSGDKSGYSSGPTTIGIAINSTSVPFFSTEHWDPAFIRSPIVFGGSAAAGFHYLQLTQGTASSGLGFFAYGQIWGWVIN